MSEYFRVERPGSGPVPVVVSVPHAGEWIPEDVPGEMAIDDRSPLRRDLDLYTDELWRGAPTVGATLIVSQVSRYVVDLNRAHDDISPRTVQGGRRVHDAGYYQERGVVWRTATNGTPVMSRAMTQEEYRARIERFWRPYHDTLADEIERVREAFGFCILVDGHSMPSVGRATNGRAAPRRADIVPGDAEGTSCRRTLLAAVSAHFDDRGYSVAANAPYKGGWITRRYGRPDDSVHAIQIEVNRDLYMNERTFEKKEAGMRRLEVDCRELLERVATIEF